MSLPRALVETLGIDPAEQESVLKDLAILARIKTAEARGMVIMEIERTTFERYAGGEVEWTKDEMGFSAPRLRLASTGATGEQPVTTPYEVDET